MPRSKTADESQARTNAVRRDLRAGHDVKEVAMNHGLGTNTVYGIAHSIGLRRRYITQQEWREVIKQRHNS
jgi:hypothetical protein